MSHYKYYKDLTIHEKINWKSWNFWRLPNKDGFMLTMIDNADYDKREDYAGYTRHCIADYHHFAMPRRNITQGIFNKLFRGNL